MKILIAYDGSSGAGAAILTAAKLLDDQDVDTTVLSVWEPLMVETLRVLKYSAPIVPVSSDPSEIDKRSQHHARELAEHGARIAEEAGLDARALWAADERTVADLIIEDAEELDVDLIVLGSRGLTGVRALLGSVSNHVLQHAHRPVLVVPPTANAQLARTVEASHRKADQVTS